MPQEIIETLIYSGIGIAIAMIAFVIIDLITPGRLRQQIVDDRNMPLALVTASLILGVCIIIAACIFG